MIPVAQPFIGKEEIDNVTQALQSGWISKGEFVESFEEEFAKYCGVRYGIAVSSGTAALHLALEALGIGPGDEVIVPALTFIATANAVHYTGARPVFVDIDEYHWGIDTLELKDKIARKTRAIIPVHLYGHPSVSCVGKSYNIPVVEDVAEAPGAEISGKKVGSWGDIGCFSFYGNKIITTGEGGMCVTNDESSAERMRLLRNQGMDPKRRYWHSTIGFNYRMTNLQAAVGVAQLKRLDGFIAKKREIARWYEEGLKDLAKSGAITLHPEADWAKCVYWLYSILIKKTVFGMGRDQLMAALKKKGIETRPFFGVIPYMTPYLDDGNYPIAERVSSEGINLPSSPNLTQAEVEEVIERIKECSVTSVEKT